MSGNTPPVYARDYIRSAQVASLGYLVPRLITVPSSAFIYHLCGQKKFNIFMDLKGAPQLFKLGFENEPEAALDFIGGHAFKIASQVSAVPHKARMDFAREEPTYRAEW